MCAAATVVGTGRDTQDACKRAGAGIAAGRAVVDAGVATCQRFGLRAAAGVAALAALGLRQQAVEAFDESVRGAGGVHAWRAPVDSDCVGGVAGALQRTGMPGSAPASASSSANAPPSKPADRIMPSLIPKRILRGARLAMKTTLRPTSLSGSP